MKFLKRIAGFPPCGEDEYDSFINYCIFVEADLAEKLHDRLKLKQIKPFLDKECLKKGENWKVGFLRGLKVSRTFLAAYSSKGLSPCREATRDHSGDIALLEYHIALAINESAGKFVVLLHIGEYTSDGLLKKFGDFNLALYPDVSM